MSDSLLLAVTENGVWRLGIGDPTPMGWFTVFGYVAATIACWSVWRKEQRAVRRSSIGSPSFWMILTLLMLFLGINKQLDLQSLLTDIGRRMAKADGWYQNRRFYQRVFIASLFVAGPIVLGVFGWLARKQSKRNFTALLGTVFLCVFVLTRASSFHNVDIFFGSTIGGWRWNWILELGGIAMVLAGAFISLSRKHQESATAQGITC